MVDRPKDAELLRLSPCAPDSMQYGYFDDDNREYVISRPDTPLPWINYLGCQAFFGLISNTAGGYSFYRDARLRRLTRYRYNNVPLTGAAVTSIYATIGPEISGHPPGSPPPASWKTTSVVMEWGTASSERAATTSRR